MQIIVKIKNNNSHHSELPRIASDPCSKLHVIDHESHSLAVCASKVSSLKYSDQEALSSFLNSCDSSALEPYLGIDSFSNTADESLEGDLLDQGRALHNKFSK